jgi:uncharacterized membrane protein
LSTLASVNLEFGQPWWLAAALLAVPAIWLAWRNLAVVGKARRLTAVVLRAAVITLLAIILARPSLTSTAEPLALIAVVDRSQSIPQAQHDAAMDYLAAAIGSHGPDDRLGVIDVAEDAAIGMLPGGEMTVGRRNTSLRGSQSNIAAGIELGMAIAPPDHGVRMLLVSDGNETAGELRASARAAAAAGIPIDVLPVAYDYGREVVVSQLVCPVRARVGQTIPVRMVLKADAPASGKLLLSLNGSPIDLDPDSDELAQPITLKSGTNVEAISMPVNSAGIHDFRVSFLPDAGFDNIEANNRASGVTLVSGPGHVLLVDTDGLASSKISQTLRDAQINVRYAVPTDIPPRLSDLIGCDAIVLCDVDASSLSLAQQEMLCRYVTEMGGGLVMTGGPNSFGAGGWIGSPVAEILPVDLDPPQKKQMPQGALVVVIDRSGSMSGEKLKTAKLAAVGAAKAVSSRDYLGVIAFDTVAEWKVPLALASDKGAIEGRIRRIGEGGGTDMYPAMVNARNALKKLNVGVRHVILLTDGHTGGGDCRKMAMEMAKDHISVSTVAVGPDADSALLHDIARITKGRFHQVNDPKQLPKIFVKEAQVVRRALIVEKRITPRVTFGVNEIMRGIDALPPLDGYVLTGPKGGLSQLVMVEPADEDPILAAGHAGLGRCVAFTSAADSRWANSWVNWGGFGRFWEQAVRWTAKPAQGADCEIFTDVQGRRVTVTVEAVEASGKSAAISQLSAQVIGPNMKPIDLPLAQVGPGRYRGGFEGGESGSYLINLRYQAVGAGEAGSQLTHGVVNVPYAPEFRDLTHNAALLAEVARTTGGRVITGPPAQAQLFSPDGVRMPKASRELTEGLLLLWLALMLADVAGRRLAVDFRAIARRLGRLARPRRKAAVADGTIAQLQRTRDQYRSERQAKSAHARAQARRRYVPGQSSAEALPTEDDSAEAPAERRAPAPAAAKAKPQDAAPSTQNDPPDNLAQLLQAKRRARGQGPSDGENR